MAPRLSKEDRRKISATLEREEEAKKAQMRARDDKELRKLTRQTRMMKEAKLRDAAMEKHGKVKDILTNEKDSLEDNLRLMKSTRRCKLDSKQAQDISNLFAQGDDLDAAIAQEKNHIQDLESQIRKDTRNIQEVKKNKGETIKFGSEYMQKKEHERADRTMESWKSRLAAEQTQLALVIKENEEMRTKLQRLMREKGQFNKLFGELMGKLTRGKGIMVDVVERSRQQFQKRDEVYRKIEALRSRDKTDLAKRMEEMQEMEMKFYEDKKLASFRYRVQQVREKLEEELESSNKGSVQQHEVMVRLQKANDYWARLQEVTGLTDCEEICKYIVAEDNNLFSLFNFNNEIHDQVEVLTNKTAELVITVNDETAIAEENLADSIRKRHVVEKKLIQMEQNLSDLKDLYGSNSRLFNRLLDKIKTLVVLMKCNTSTLHDLLGDNARVTEHNFRLYLDLVETEVLALLEALGPMVGGRGGAASTTSRSERRVDSRTLTSGTIGGPSVPLKRILTRACLECERGRRTKL